MEFKTLFPEFESFDFGYLKVDDIHEIYYEQSGNPNGAPVVFVHGGPGCGCGEKSKRFLDPSFYRIVTIDQRGCGKSKPFLELKDLFMAVLGELLYPYTMQKIIHKVL